ncbi:probable LRR receptor-like serine/threonine-protein kinase At1g07650 isoform X4 [Beta vulgaris subsp. vulgaris]|uniref:probable LRR receptor-like serine/threonine-protein kinase At1g07650 isoform X4 n=1 Tax=Beta vulgaris subsp. vulgaris TaxID=3555 RepID=UPI00254885A8|nr:probable LRR receptor-like serine/threonine-protein kinase At1g07650 isoform X4 [Beta vulgaris subsp. vulgaris]
MGSALLGTVSSMLLLILFWVVFPQFGSSSNLCERTSAKEVKALQEIAEEMRKMDWNFEKDPCSNHTSWFSERDPARVTYVNQVTCKCFGGKWHLTNMSLKGQDLSGGLPKSLVKLHYLKTIDLSRNLLSGRIPEEWAKMKLKYVSIESNLFSGTVPAELGKLVNLKILILNDNNLGGQLPIELHKLARLTELKISSNKFSGRIPDFIQKWKQLKKLEIQGSGFSGPIPLSISLLTNLVELRISDLNGEGSKFPSLENLTHLVRLMLRSCKLYGSIPRYIANMSNLKILDLSFNKLNGSIPNELQYINSLQNMYLANNMLSGPIPGWITNKVDSSHIDLSYNNFDKSSAPSSCNKETLNLYRSFSGEGSLKSSVCLKNFHCRAQYSLHINCGGTETTIRKSTYDEDDERGGAAKFVPRRAEWGFSSSGEFWYSQVPSNYIAKGNPLLGLKDSKLYMTARLSATSLTYYGSCLGKGNYSVTLHFHEIVFANNSYSSLGRRIFDIYIQDKLVHKNFNILEETNKTNTVVKKVFQHIPVNDIIEICFYYAGKGSTGIPVRGTYGPLISAISVKSEFKPPLDRRKITRISGGVATFLLCTTIVGIFICWRKHRSKDMASREQVLAGLDLQTGLFTFRQIKAATNNFSADSKIGEGGFGTVYLGILLDGTHIAVKLLSSRSKQGNQEFVNEIGMISGLRHPNLVRLYGCCVEGSQLFLIYEYMENNNLARALFDNSQLKLNWPTRQKICIGVARGLTFLHEESTIKIVHRDIKATNILLDKDLNAKISDFGLARLDEGGRTHISTRVAGTIGYMAPEYALWGYLTYKADVYSFGVFALEIVAGRSNTNFKPDDNYFCLLDWAFALQQQKGNIMELVDPKLGTDYKKEEVLRMIKIALLCTNPSPAVRPVMSEVLSMLEGSMVVQELTLAPGIHSNDWIYQASRRYHDMPSDSETQSLICSLGARNNIPTHQPKSSVIEGDQM